MQAKELFGRHVFEGIMSESPSPSSRARPRARSASSSSRFSAPALSAFIGMPGAWYAGAAKAILESASWLFGPAWTLLVHADGGRGVAGVEAWRLFEAAEALLRATGAQCRVDADVSSARMQLGWALLEIVALWIAILLTLLSFRRVSTARPDGCSCRIWPGSRFATVSTFTLWRLNPS
jgi:benzodiazapine receptor